MNVLGNRLLVNEGADPKELQFVFGDDANSESDSRGLYYSLGRARTATFLDVNQDGLLDVFLGNEPRPDHGFPSIWFIQQKDHTFVRDRETLESKAMASHSQFPPTLTAMGRWISF
jgi:hypothetical protein